MFDNRNFSNTTIKANAVPGTLVKSYRNSFFVRFRLGSRYADELLDSRHRINDKPATVIQCMCAGGKNGDEIIAEVMWEQDFNEMFKEEKADDGFTN